MDPVHGVLNLFGFDTGRRQDDQGLLFQVQLEPWYYDPRTVAVSKVIPMHPGATKYYRQRGYIKSGACGVAIQSSSHYCAIWRFKFSV